MIASTCILSGFRVVPTVARPCTTDHAMYGAASRCLRSIMSVSLRAVRHSFSTSQGDGSSGPSGAASQAAKATSKRPGFVTAKRMYARPIASNRTTAHFVPTRSGAASPQDAFAASCIARASASRARRETAARR